MINRRRFLQNSAVVTLTPMIPSFVAHSVRAASAERERNVLVVIQLDGGNDGINTVVPFKDEGYAANRKALRLKTSNLIKLNDEVGLHPRMRGAGELFDEGWLGIVQGVGYPNPDRSHFRSMAIWHAGDINVEAQHGSGWIGQSLSSRADRDDGPDAIYVGTNELPVALRGRRCVSVTMANEEDLTLKLSGLGANMRNSQGVESTSEDLTSFLQRSVSQAYVTAKELSEPTDRVDSGDTNYPRTELAGRLKLVSRMIKSGATTRVYYASQSGYDTHALQLATHAGLLGEFSDALKAFVRDMKAAGLYDRVMVLAFSEFGRRVRENGSTGTDHGTAGPVFLAGGNVTAGLHGTIPSLTDLDSGDLKHTIDFRNVYATLLDSWLQVARPKFLDSFDALPIIASS